MKAAHAYNSVLGLLLFTLILLGSSIALGAASQNIITIFEFYQLNKFIPNQAQNLLAGGLLIATAVLILASQKLPKLKFIAFLSLILIACIPLLTLLSESRWMVALGGFPVIGSGQGVIKYSALIALALFLFQAQNFSKQSMALINMIPVVLVLVWIGAMKFYDFEAKGIESLVATSPLMSWLYWLFSLQTASNLIGTYDLLFAFALTLAVFNKHTTATNLTTFGCAAVFIMTQTFLFSAPGAFSNETILAGLGVFVIKDLWFIANLLVVIYCINSQKIK